MDREIEISLLKYYRKQSLKIHPTDAIILFRFDYKDMALFLAYINLYKTVRR